MNSYLAVDKIPYWLKVIDKSKSITIWMQIKKNKVPSDPVVKII